MNMSERSRKWKSVVERDDGSIVTCEGTSESIRAHWVCT